MDGPSREDVLKRTEFLDDVVQTLQFKCLQPWIHLEQGSGSWNMIADNEHTLGASEVASAAGVIGAYHSRPALWRIKKGLQKQEVNVMMHYGIETEIIAIKQLIRQLTGEEVEGRQEMFGQFCLFAWNPGRWICEDDQRYRCSPDGIFFDELGSLDLLWQDVVQRANKDLSQLPPPRNSWLIEIKCPFSGLPYDVPKSNHLAQILMQMHITKIHRCLYVVYTPNHDLKVHAYVVLYDKGVWQQLKARADDFLRMVQQNIVPPRLGSKWHIPLQCYEVEDFPRSESEK